MRKVRAGGFTLIELLVTLLIVAVLMAVALPLYLSSVTDSQKKACRRNMKTVANAVQCARVRSVAPAYGAIIAAGVPGILAADLGVTPICPGAGTYGLENGNTGDGSTFKVTCTLAAHGSFQPGLDAN